MRQQDLRDRLRLALEPAAAALAPERHLASVKKPQTTQLAGLMQGAHGAQTTRVAASGRGVPSSWAFDWWAWLGSVNAPSSPSIAAALTDRAEIRPRPTAAFQATALPPSPDSRMHHNAALRHRVLSALRGCDPVRGQHR